jgi:phosphoribosylpyrophosphate synthetase
MWHTLRHYKDSPSEDARTRFGDQVAATLARFLGLHRSCIETALGSPLTGVSTVPSSGSRSGTHPLEAAVRRVSSIGNLNTIPLRRGSALTTHNSASDAGYEVVDDATGHHILLIDDTFTTGARSQSAASALGLAGASSVAVLAIGRVIDPTWNDACAEIWSKRHPFDFGVCCLE